MCCWSVCIIYKWQKGRNFVLRFFFIRRCSFQLNGTWVKVDNLYAIQVKFDDPIVTWIICIFGYFTFTCLSILYSFFSWVMHVYKIRMRMICNIMLSPSVCVCYAIVYNMSKKQLCWLCWTAVFALQNTKTNVFGFGVVKIKTYFKLFLLKSLDNYIYTLFW